MLAKGFCSHMGDMKCHFSAEERNCLEGAYTVKRSEKWVGDESEKKLRQTVDSL